MRSAFLQALPALPAMNLKLTCAFWCSCEPYEVSVEGGGLFTTKLLDAFGGASTQLLYHGKVGLLMVPWRCVSVLRCCLGRRVFTVMFLKISGSMQVGPAVDRLVLPGEENTDPENDKELHVSTDILLVCLQLLCSCPASLGQAALTKTHNLHLQAASQVYPELWNPCTCCSSRLAATAEAV